MTRAEFIQCLLTNGPIRGTQQEIDAAVAFADALEKSGATPWDDTRCSPRR